MRRRKHFLDDLDHDIREHIERETQDNIDRGMSSEDARYAALRKFGNVTRVKEETREVWTIVWLEQLFQDVRFGLRMLRKNPGFATVAVLTLALGIGANTAIFSLINAVMLRTLPVRDPQHLLILKWAALHDPKTNVSYFWSGCPAASDDSKKHIAGGCTFSYPMYEQIREQRNVFSAVTAFTGAKQVHVTANGAVGMATTQLVSGDFFSTLGVRAIMGRPLDSMDDVPGAPPALTLSYGYWKSRFVGDPSIVGKTILVENTGFTVVGVAAPSFTGIDPGLPMDMWVPLSSQFVLAPYLPKRAARNSFWVDILARLRPNVSEDQARTALQVIFVPGVTIGAEAPFKPDDLPHIELGSASRGLFSLRREFSQPLFVLMVTVGIILLIACANVGGLSLARATSRQQEIAMRFMLGATPGRIARQVLTESLLIAASGGVLGILLAYWSANALAAFLAANWYTPLELDVHRDGTVLAFAILVAALTGVLFGLAPALRGMRIDLAPTIKGGVDKAPAVFGARRFGFGSFLVVVQIALSIVILAGAGLLVRTLVKLESQNVGFDTQNLLLFTLDTHLTGYKAGRAPDLYREVQDDLASIPGVESATHSSGALLSGTDMTTRFELPGTIQGVKVPSDVLPIGPDFFRTMHIPLLAGRTFMASDFNVEAKTQLTVVNEALASRLFGKQNPLGQHFKESGIETSWFVVGVVPNAKYESLRREPGPTAFVPLVDEGGAEFELRTTQSPRAFIPAVRSTVSRVNSNILISHIKTQTEEIDQSLYQERLVAGLSTLFGALALLLVCIGLYGLLSYEVAGRTHEIGIRMALGAQQHQVLRLIVRQGLVLAFTGAAIGVTAAAGITRYLQSLLYGVRPTDPYTFVSVVALLALVATVACYLPARRATRVDPMVSLRHE
jgi:predicted permease